MYLVSNIYSGLLSASVQDQWSHAALRPLGTTDLLLGVDYLSLHPVDFESQGTSGFIYHSLVIGSLLLVHILALNSKLLL